MFGKDDSSLNVIENERKFFLLERETSLRMRKRRGAGATRGRERLTNRWAAVSTWPRGGASAAVLPSRAAVPPLERLPAAGPAEELLLLALAPDLAHVHVSGRAGFLLLLLLFESAVFQRVREIQ